MSTRKAQVIEPIEASHNGTVCAVVDDNEISLRLFDDDGEVATFTLDAFAGALRAVASREVVEQFAQRLIDYRASEWLAEFDPFMTFHIPDAITDAHTDPATCLRVYAAYCMSAPGMNRHRRVAQAARALALAIAHENPEDIPPYSGYTWQQALPVLEALAVRAVWVDHPAFEATLRAVWPWETPWK